MKDLLFKPKEAAIILGVEAWNLSNETLRSIRKPLRPATRAGSHYARYSYQDLLCMKLFKKMQKMGVPLVIRHEFVEFYKCRLEIKSRMPKFFCYAEHFFVFYNNDELRRFLQNYSDVFLIINIGEFQKQAENEIDKFAGCF